MYVKIIYQIYDYVKTNVKIVCEKAKNITMKVGVHQGSTFSPYLFSLVLDEPTRRKR